MLTVQSEISKYNNIYYVKENKNFNSLTNVGFRGKNYTKHFNIAKKIDTFLAKEDPFYRKQQNVTITNLKNGGYKYEYKLNNNFTTSYMFNRILWIFNKKGECDKSIAFRTVDGKVNSYSVSKYAQDKGFYKIKTMEKCNRRYRWDPQLKHYTLWIRNFVDAKKGFCNTEFINVIEDNLIKLRKTKKQETILFCNPNSTRPTVMYYMENKMQFIKQPGVTKRLVDSCVNYITNKQKNDLHRLFKETGGGLCCW